MLMAFNGFLIACLIKKSNHIGDEAPLFVAK